MAMEAVLIYEQTDIPPGMTCDEYRRLIRTNDRARARRLAIVSRALRAVARHLI